MTPFIDRMIRAAKLDVNLYEEVEADKGAMSQATGVVVISSLAGGIGFMQQAGLTGLLIGTVGSLLGWYIWAFMTYVIGTKLLPEPGTRADYGELLRTIGFSSAPGLIRIFSIIPGLGMPVNLLASIWMLVAMVIAVRQALDYQSTYRALGVCLIGWLVQAVILALLMPMMGEVPVAMLDN
ncbi:MAG: YIP1 family protein [Nitrospirota bacterium]|nr:YIP1 family protein [Nitrospirota bacterium]